MRNIYFASNFQNELFPQNTRSKFECYIQPTDLNYITSQDVEIAIKSITFDYDIESKSPQILGLKSNLSFDTIYSFGYNNIVAILTINPSDKGVLQFEFNNPTFFLTNHQKLSKASFHIIDLKTGETPNFGLGSPTFIEVVVRSRLRRIKPSFHILIDSSCVESKKRFPKNTNMDFIIQLPQRMSFQRDWSICVKSIHFSHQFYALTTCKITLSGVKSDGNKWVKEFELPEKIGIDEIMLVKEFNKLLKKFLKLTVFVFVTLKKMKIETHHRYKASVYGDHFNVTFSENLSKVLGLKQTTYTINSSDKNQVISSDCKSNISSLHPFHFIICCDIVEESILSGEQVQVLKYFPRKELGVSAVDYTFNHNEWKKLSLKHFDRIHIRIVDLNGNTISCDPTIPTRIQLLFINANSM